MLFDGNEILFRLFITMPIHTRVTVDRSLMNRIGGMQCAAYVCEQISSRTYHRY